MTTPAPEGEAVAWATLDHRNRISLHWPAGEEDARSMSERYAEARNGHPDDGSGEGPTIRAAIDAARGGEG
jgi:hypothetical protein